MDTSILRSTKKILGIPAEDTSFDLDIITSINSAFSTLRDLGVGPEEGFVIMDDEPQWEDFSPELNEAQLSQVKTYVYLRTRLVFDAPQTSYLITALNDQIREHEWRLNMRREETEYVDPERPKFPYLDGGDAAGGAI